MATTPGTIRGREAREVMTEILKARGVSMAIVSFRQKELRLLINDVVHKIPCKRGMTFHQLKAATEMLERAIETLKASRASRNQIDLEQLIQEAV